MINGLTEDQDHRQELWIHFLEGNPPESLNTYLRRLKLEEDIYKNFQNYMTNEFNDKDVSAFSKLLDKFSLFEQSIVSMIYIGCSMQQIAEYKSTDVVRIRQAITVIRQNPAWDDYLWP